MKKILILFLILGIAYSQEPQWNWAIDGPALGLGLGFQFWGNYQLNQLDESLFSKEELFGWDQAVVGTRDPFWSQMSNVISAPGLLVPLGISAWQSQNNSYDYLLTDFLMLTQILTWNSALNLWVRSLGFWERPEFHHEKNTLTSGQIKGSFYSGHASAAFAVATYFSLQMPNRYKGPHQWVIPTAMYSMATAVAMARVAAGKHYWTDVIVGAGVGILLSWGIHALHLPDNDVALNLDAKTYALNFRFPF